jgi:NADPH:quinone reductase-like Zn-dependent oxidoreductase
MQAIRVHHFGGLDALVVEDVPRPTPGEGEV